jgi:transposase
MSINTHSNMGCSREEGSVFVSRMLTVITSLRSQNRNVLEFMTDAVRANRKGTTPPSLLPQ